MKTDWNMSNKCQFKIKYTYIYIYYILLSTHLWVDHNMRIKSGQFPKLGLSMFDLCHVWNCMNKFEYDQLQICPRLQRGHVQVSGLLELFHILACHSIPYSSTHDNENWRTPLDWYHPLRLVRVPYVSSPCPPISAGTTSSSSSFKSWWPLCTHSQIIGSKYRHTYLRILVA